LSAKGVQLLSVNQIFLDHGVDFEGGRLEEMLQKKVLLLDVSLEFGPESLLIEKDRGGEFPPGRPLSS